MAVAETLHAGGVEEVGVWRVTTTPGTPAPALVAATVTPASGTREELGCTLGPTMTSQKQVGAGSCGAVAGGRGRGGGGACAHWTTSAGRQCQALLFRIHGGQGPGGPGVRLLPLPPTRPTPLLLAPCIWLPASCSLVLVAWEHHRLARLSWAAWLRRDRRCVLHPPLPPPLPFRKTTARPSPTHTSVVPLHPASGSLLPAAWFRWHGSTTFWHAFRGPRG